MCFRDYFYDIYNSVPLIVTVFTIVFLIVPEYEWRCVISFENSLTGHISLFVYHCMVVCYFSPLLWFMKAVENNSD